MRVMRTCSQHEQPARGLLPTRMHNMSWQVGRQQPGAYVPQLGDEVVYLRDGHAAFLEQTSDKRRPPWQALVPADVRATPFQSLF